MQWDERCEVLSFSSCVVSLSHHACPGSTPCAQFDVVEDEVEEDGERKPSRKQKSLGLLCQKFLALYPDYPASSQEINISLDEVATSLGKRAGQGQCLLAP